MLSKEDIVQTLKLQSSSFVLTFWFKARLFIHAFGFEARLLFEHFEILVSKQDFKFVQDINYKASKQDFVTIFWFRK